MKENRLNKAPHSFYEKHNVSALSIIGNENGATSVLVIFMLIVLVALGSFAISSANVNRKLGTKTISWNDGYYKLDRTAEEYIASIDYYLYKAELDAIDYIRNERYLGGSSSLEREIQNAIVSAYNSGTSLTDITNQLYLYYVKQEIEPLQTKYSNFVINDVIEKDFLNYEINDMPFISFTINGEDIEKTNNINLTVDIKLLPLEYTFTETSEGILAERKMDKRYKIVSYQEWQTPFDYNTEIDWYTPPVMEMEIIE